MFDYDEKLIRVTEYEVLGKLPDPFTFDDGSRMTCRSDWEKRRKEIYRTAVELQYGTQPPKPEVFRSEVCSGHFRRGESASVRITAGTAEKQVTFVMKVFMPRDDVPHPPVVVDGDLCFGYAFNRDFVSAMTDNGIAYAVFDRTSLANDVRHQGRRNGPLYDVYPGYTFGALGAWAWGYSRCVDALEATGVFNMDALAFTGHSRGAKTAMLAGVLDERAKIVNPNETNCGSCSCYRIHMKEITEGGEEKPGETLADLWDRFDFWVGEGMGEYVGHEEKLPFDCHFLKSMVAPRVLLVGEAASDAWTNPVGSWQTSVAATEVYDYLGCRDHLLWYFRKGYHEHHVEDVRMLVNTIRHFAYGEELNGHCFKTPFEKPELIYDWKQPETK